MARTTIPVVNAVGNGSIAAPAGTAVPTTGGTIPNADTEHLLLQIVNGATAATVTIDAGAYPPALAAGLGPLTIAVAASETVYAGPFESGRFIQADGSLSIDTNEAITVTAFVLPKAV